MMSRKGYYGWRIVTALAVTETVSWGVLYYAFSVFITPMEAEWGWTQAELTGAFSLALLVAGLAAIPVGYWIDRHGARWLMTLGSIAAAILVLAWAVVDSRPIFYLIWFGIGLTMAMILYEPAFVVVAKWFSRRRGTALAIITFAAGFASTIFLPLADVLLRTYGWRTAVTLLGLGLAVITIPLHALVLRRSPEDLNQRIDGERENVPQRSLPPSLTMRAALSQATFWWLVAAFALAMLASTAIRVHFIPYLIERGFDSSLAAVAAGLIGAMQVLGRLIFAPLHNHLPLRRLAAALFGLQGLALAILILGDSDASIVLFVIVFGAAYGAVTLARPALLAEIYGPAHYGRISSVMAMILTWAVTAAPVGASLLQGYWGSYQPVLWVLIGLTTAASVTVLFLRHHPAD
jgi:MFS family permease